MPFALKSDYRPCGDQPQAIEALVRGINDGSRDQVLLGITGSGKTFTVASVIAETQRPTLVIAHNKTLAAQLYQEFRTLFPESAVEYFVSYYDYYQPEAYVPASDTYIEKDAIVNEDIDRLRMSATRALFERRDVIVVASVSCIYGLGDPDAYYGMLVFLEPGMRIARDTLLQRLVELQYERSDIDFKRGSFRVRGDVVEVYPSYQDEAYRVELWGDEIDSISTIDPLLGEVTQRHTARGPIYPKSHYEIARSMFFGDQSRKRTLVEYGFRLPSALDNRPLNFDEFEERVSQRIYVSATPGPYELTKSSGEVIEQIIRPTGLMDPEVEVLPVKGQIDHLLGECRERAAHKERVLVTTLTKRMAEDLTEYFTELDVRVRYLHSDIVTLERIKILRDLRRGEFDVLVGINLLREGLDLPEVSLVAILDADKEGFLRSESSLIQTIGRAARNSRGKAILYADRVTDSMKRAIDETRRRRALQEVYNREHGITPMTIIKPIESTLVTASEADYFKVPLELEDIEGYSAAQIDEQIKRFEFEMREHAKRFEFEKAAELRDRIKYLRERELAVA